MKASMLFTLAIALLVGLGLVVAAKVTGYFNPLPEKKAPTPPTVVVSARNLFAGDALRLADVTVRPLKPEEAASYQRDAASYLAVPESAHLRTALKNIPADQPITEQMLEPMEKPEALNARLLPMTRAIDLAVTPENSAAGLIQVGDWVDVYLTSDIGKTGGGSPSLRTALLARNVEVVAKRGTLYQMYAPLKPGPIQFTLAPNLYRAALIDHARNKGVISLQPVSQNEKKTLVALKAEVEKEPEKVVALSLAPDGEEYVDELRRVRQADQGETVAGDEDLIRLFSLQPLTPANLVTVEYFRGVKRSGGATFQKVNGSLEEKTSPDKVDAYIFTTPKASGKAATTAPSMK